MISSVRPLDIIILRVGGAWIPGQYPADADKIGQDAKNGYLVKQLWEAVAKTRVKL